MFGVLSFIAHFYLPHRSGIAPLKSPLHFQSDYATLMFDPSVPFISFILLYPSAICKTGHITAIGLFSSLILGKQKRMFGL
jgi:hypothetical protein